MKKNFLFLLGLACYIPTMAQQWRIAPTLGLNGSTTSFSTAYKNGFLNNNITDISTGLAVKVQAGALIDYSINERFSIRSGLLYTSKGSTFRYGTSFSAYTTTIQGDFQFNYLDIPLLVAVSLGDNDLWVVGGPVVGITLNGQTTLKPYTVAGQTVEGRQTELSIGTGSNDGLLPTDLSISLGLVKQFDLANRPFELGIHIQPSLSGWNASSKQQPTETATNFMIGLKASYFFNLSQY